MLFNFSVNLKTHTKNNGMEYESATICYWSGTGNTLRISKWVYAFLKNRVRDVSAASITNPDPGGPIRTGADSLLLVLMPTHGFTAPWPVIKYCPRMPRGRGTHAATIANGGGSHPGFYLPGFSGSANFIISLILLLKGYGIRGFIDIDMPVSWAAFFPSLNKAHAEHFPERAEGRVRSFMETIVSGKRHIIGLRNVLEFVFGTLLLPVSCLYIIFGRLFFAKLQFANTKCNSCAICAENCPHGAILMKGRQGFEKPYWTFNCESCGRCLSYCPQKAVETGHSMGVLIWYATSLTTSFFLLDRVLSPELASLLNNRIISFIIYYALFILTVFACYHALYYLLKVPLINKFFALTSGTHWWTRYHEPSARVRDLTP